MAERDLQHASAFFRILLMTAPPAASFVLESSGITMGWLIQASAGGAWWKTSPLVRNRCDPIPFGRGLYQRCDMRRKKPNWSKMRLMLEDLEARVLLSGSTPVTADGLPWEILGHGPSAVEAENFDYGGEGVAYHSHYAKNPGGAYRPNEGIGIEGPSANTGGTYNVGYFGA